MPVRSKSRRNSAYYRYALKQASEAGGNDASPRLWLAAAAEERLVLRTVERGPPPRSEITRKNWKLWHEDRYFCCPATAYKYTCDDDDCGIAAGCREMRAKGLAGNGLPLPHRKRPRCGARNRRGEPCAVRVEHGRRRCRFHGGLSTGPRTVEGRARIAEAQRRRWRRETGGMVAWVICRPTS